MLRVAVPNKGALSESATTMLREAGYSLRSSTKTLVHRDPENEIEFFYLRPRDIAVYIGRGILDIGITGRDLLLESEAPATEILPLGFGRSRFHYAGVIGAFSDPAELAGKTIATSYPVLVDADLRKRGIEATTVKLDGAVEVSIELGVADAIADVVETGTTLRMAGLETFGEPIIHSEGVLIARDEAAVPGADVFLRRVQSVMVARDYVLIDYDIHSDDLDAAVELTPGFASPTVSTLRDPEWFAVRAMVAAQDSHRIMDRLYDVGARAILVTPIGACRM
ncbi:ATP phosphoribosyltransferase [Brevibacterium daeguense]|uniref:ATP phosphoribosyltransferase n=1 Tax=Brevibacterium daeguense TaxID=909936 RepID=A0ABP8ENX0_9MICO|nr:ATP phosphoribosyltransferase [Brevibacterium daeguense]